jgi:hypothetical protein
MWSGSPYTLPSNWKICDGTYPGTPNLKGRFIVGHNPASSTIPQNVTTQKTENYGTIGNTGGETTHTLSVPEMPSHHHGSGSDMYAGNRAEDIGGGLQSYYKELGKATLPHTRPNSRMTQAMAVLTKTVLPITF